MSSTTSAAAPSASPSSPRFHFPSAVPRKEQPNAHPYAIQTSSTAILSRSNSTSAHASVGPHHYIPMSPSPTSPNHSPTKVHRPSRHRYSRSLTSDQPPSLPPPPGMNQTQDNTPRNRGHRADTLPSSAGLSLQNLDLPDDPKSWTPPQLSMYLSAALRTGDANLPAPVAKDIARFVNERSITGKTFLRFSEDDLLQYVPFLACYLNPHINQTDSESINSGVQLYSLHPASYARQFCVAGYGGSVTHLPMKMKKILVVSRPRPRLVPTGTKPRGQKVGPATVERSKAWWSHLKCRPPFVQDWTAMDKMCLTILMAQASQQSQKRRLLPAMHLSRRITTKTFLRPHLRRRVIDLYLLEVW